MSRLAGLPVSLPSVQLPEGTDGKQVALTLQDVFADLKPEHFVADAAWRDTYAFTGTLRTFYGAEGIVAAWEAVTPRAKPTNFQLLNDLTRVTATPAGLSWVDMAFRFETTSAPPLICTAMLSVVKNPDGDGYKIWSMRTILDQIKGQPSVDKYEAPTETNGDKATTNGKAHDADFDCVIVGGGQSGLTTGGRCQALGLSYVVLEKNKAVGDNWRNRYDSARLHTIKHYTHLPFDRTWQDEKYGEFLHKDELAEGYVAWVEKFKINVWLSTTVLSGTWDNAAKTWHLKISRDGSDEDVTCKFIIMAVGAGGQIATMPDLPGKDKFEGIALHSEHYTSPKDWAGKHAVVIGTANTAHDVAEDMLDAGCATTTMVQRSETFVLPVEWFSIAQRNTYNATFPTATADMIGNSAPTAINRIIQMSSIHFMTRKNIHRFEALQKAGFRCHVYGDPLWHLLERLGGHYMDVGCSQKISDGLIKMKSDSALTHYTPKGLGFADGSVIPADVVVFATGFDLNIRNRVRELFGDETADQIGDFSYINDEGEMDGAFVFQHPGIACMGGGIGLCRWYSRFFALYIKAAAMGTPLWVYRDTPIPPKWKT